MKNELKVIILNDGSPDADGLYEQYKLAKENEAAYCGFKFEIAYLYNKDSEFYFYEKIKAYQYKRVELELEKGLKIKFQDIILEWAIAARLGKMPFVYQVRTICVLTLGW